MKSLFSLVLLLTTTSTIAAPESAVEYNMLCDSQCTVVLKNDSNNQYQIVNQKRANTQLTPFSTFKVPNTLILLETGIVKDRTQRFAVDLTRYKKQKWWPQSWTDKPLVIRDAFQYSALPLYQQLSSQAGRAVYQKYLSEFGYGNQDSSSNIDDFWLNRSLKISAIEQVDFLQKLYQRQFSLSQRTYNEFEKIMLVETTDDYQLYAKTGGGQVAKNDALGWYVGIVKRKDSVHYFAANVNDPNFRFAMKKRIQVARAELKKAGLL